MVKIKNFLYGTALFVASVVALYGLKPIGTTQAAATITFAGHGRLGGKGSRGASQYGYQQGFS